MSSDTPRVDRHLGAFGSSRLIELAESLERELTALRKEREWRPMETAPRDGVPILVAYEDGKIGLAHRFPGFCWYEVVAGKIPIAWLPLPDTHAITGGEG